MFKFVQISLVSIIFLFSPVLGSIAHAKSLRLASSSEFVSFDPHLAYDFLSYDIISQICGNLVALSGDGTVTVPETAETMEFENDGQTIVFKLRPEERFHDGTPVRAADVIHSLNRVTNPEFNSPGANMFAMILGFDEYQNGSTETLAGVKALDEHTVQINLKRPSRSFILALATNFGCILPKTTPFQEIDIDHPISNGLFKFESFSNDGVLRLSNTYARPQKYFTSSIDEIIVDSNIVADDVLSGFSLGDYNAIYHGEDWGRISSMGAASMKVSYDDLPNASTNTTYLSLNTQSEPFNDVKLRQAVNFAIDRAKLVEILSTTATQTSQIPPPSFLEFVENKDKYPYSPERARELIAQSNYKDGLDVEIFSVDSRIHKTLIHSIVEDLQEVNIHATTYFGTHEKILEAADTDAPGRIIFSDGLGWTADYADASNFYFPVLSPNAIKESGWNWPRYDNPRIEEMAIAADKIIDPDELDKHTEAWKQIFDQIEDDAPWVPLYNRKSHLIVQRSLFSEETSDNSNSVAALNAQLSSSYILKLVVDTE